MQESLVPTALSNIVNLEGRCSVSEKPPGSCSITCTGQEHPSLKSCLPSEPLPTHTSAGAAGEPEVTHAAGVALAMQRGVICFLAVPASKLAAFSSSLPAPHLTGLFV